VRPSRLVSVWDRTNKRDLTNSDDAVTLSFPQAVASVKVYRPLQSASSISQVANASNVALSVPDDTIIVEITR
jgi:hypothetical protein